MRHLCSFLRLVSVTAVVGLAALGGAKPAEAVEYRYGNLSWKKVNPLTAEFMLTCGFRRSDYPGRSSDGRVGVGDRLTDSPLGIVLNFDDDQAAGTPLRPRFTPAAGQTGTGLEFVAVAIDPNRDLVIARAVDPASGRDRLRFTYPAAVDDSDADRGKPWRPSIGQATNQAVGADSARPVALRNNSAAQLQAANLRNFRLEAAVDLSGNTFSATSSLPTQFPVQAGGSFFVPAYDVDGNTLRYRLATADESGLLFTQPPGVTIDPITGEYSVPANLPPGQWATQVVIEEYGNAALPVGQTAVDFIFVVGSPSGGAAPAFNSLPTPPNGSVVTAVVGRPLTYLVRATDPDGDVVTINSTGVPSGARHVATLPSSGNPAQSQLSWTPTNADLGAYSIVYTAEDSSGFSTQTSLTILVIQGIDLLEPDGGEMYTVGQLVNVRWESGGGVRDAGVKIEISRDSGTTWDATPITALTADTGTFLWTVTGPFSKTNRIRVSNASDPGDYGISAADFTIADGRRSKPFCSAPGGIAIADNEPSWTEIPVNFDEDLIIRSVEVSVSITHPFIGDLEIAVIHPDGTAILLHDETGEGKANLNETFGYGYRGNVKLTLPVEPLTQLYGKRSVGVWKLRVRDLNPGDVGTVNQWCLSLVGRDTGKITVTSPVAGDRWAVATTHPITWTQVGVVADVNVQTSRDSGATWTTVATVPATDGTFTWLVSGPESTHARVRVVSVEDPVQVDDTDGDFIIQNPYLNILLPAGGESIPVGRPYQIRWDGVPLGAGEDVKIEISADGVVWTTIAGAASNTGLFTWTPTVAQKSDTARIRITANQAPSRVAQTPEFKVQQPTLAIIAPVGGETWYIETTHTIRWSTVGITGTVNVELSRNGGTTWELIAVNTDNSQAEGTVNWKVTGPATSGEEARAVVRVSSVNDPSNFGLSDRFTIKEMRTKVFSPNGGEVFGVGSTQTITWDPQDLVGTVDISISTDGGLSFSPLFTDVPNGGTATWVVGNTVSPTALIRVKAHNYLAADESDTVFSIIQPSLAVVAPTGGEELRVGSSATLKWASQGVPGRVRLDLSRDGGNTWETLFASTANDGTERWDVIGTETFNALLRVTSLDNAAVAAQSASSFSIVSPALTVTSPNGGQQWYTGTTQAITWSAKGFDGGVKVELTRNGGQSWEVLFERTENDGLQEWVVSGANATNARVRVTALDEPTIMDQTDGPFTITAPTVTIGAPNGGQVWLLGTTQTITWSGKGFTGGVDIEISLDNGSTWAPLKADGQSTNVANDGSEAWEVTGAVSSSTRIRISSHERPEISDTSDNPFSVSVPTIQVTSPAAGTVWHKQSRETITWAGSALSAGGMVDILLSRNGGKTYQTIISDTANDGSATWLVAGSTAKKCKVKVVWKSQDGVIGVSNGNFTIAGKLKVKKNKNR